MGNSLPFVKDYRHAVFTYLDKIVVDGQVVSKVTESSIIARLDVTSVAPSDTSPWHFIRLLIFPMHSCDNPSRLCVIEGISLERSRDDGAVGGRGKVKSKTCPSRHESRSIQLRKQFVINDSTIMAWKQSLHALDDGNTDDVWSEDEGGGGKEAILCNMITEMCWIHKLIEQYIHAQNKLDITLNDTVVKNLAPPSSPAPSSPPQRPGRRLTHPDGNLSPSVYNSTIGHATLSPRSGGHATPPSSYPGQSLPVISSCREVEYTEMMQGALLRSLNNLRQRQCEVRNAI